jgi:predicted RNA-binding Zn ribbon-like protein
MAQPDSKTQFDLSGGHLALDFVNTVSYRPTLAIERLPDYSRLVSFAMQSAVRLQSGAAQNLLKHSELVPGVGKSALQKAIQLREALFAIFSSAVERQMVSDKAMGLLNAAVKESIEHGNLYADGRRFVWLWSGMGDKFDSMLWPIARAAANLLMSKDLEHLRMCAAPDCAWLFLDNTKNQRRRWCDMKTCGNRVKARRHYKKAKAG